MAADARFLSKKMLTFLRRYSMIIAWFLISNNAAPPGSLTFGLKSNQFFILFQCFLSARVKRSKQLPEPFVFLVMKFIQLSNHYRKKQRNMNLILIRNQEENGFRITISYISYFIFESFKRVALRQKPFFKGPSDKNLITIYR